MALLQGEEDDTPGGPGRLGRATADNTCPGLVGRRPIDLRFGVNGEGQEERAFGRWLAVVVSRKTTVGPGMGTRS